MEELDFVAEDFLASPLATIRTSPDGKLVFRGHGDDATLLDVVSHGFFHPRRREGFFHQRRREGEDARVVPRDPSDACPVPARPGATHATRVEPPPPLTVDQRDARLESERNWSATCASTPRDVASTDRAVTREMGVCGRLAVFETDEGRDRDDAVRVVAILSPLDMIRFLSRRVDAVGALADTTLAQLGLLSRVHNGVVTAPWDRPALECFKLMRDRDVSALGVVDQTGELVANLSASDLRRLDARSFRLLALPVAEFISRRKGDAIGRRGAPFAEARRVPVVETNGREYFRDDTRAPPHPEKDVDRDENVDASPTMRTRADTDEKARARVSTNAEEKTGNRRDVFPASSRTFVELIFARADTTLRRVLHLMTTHGIHHVYVLDDDDRPVAVVTPTDVLRLLVVEDEDSAWNVVWSQHQRP